MRKPLPLSARLLRAAFSLSIALGMAFALNAHAFDFPLSLIPKDQYATDSVEYAVADLIEAALTKDAVRYVAPWEPESRERAAQQELSEVAEQALKIAHDPKELLRSTIPHYVLKKVDLNKEATTAQVEVLAFKTPAVQLYKEKWIDVSKLDCKVESYTFVKTEQGWRASGNSSSAEGEPSRLSLFAKGKAEQRPASSTSASNDVSENVTELLQVIPVDGVEWGKNAVVSIEPVLSKDIDVYSLMKNPSGAVHAYINTMLHSDVEQWLRTLSDADLKIAKAQVESLGGMKEAAEMLGQLTLGMKDSTFTFLTLQTSDQTLVGLSSAAPFSETAFDPVLSIIPVKEDHNHRYTIAKSEPAELSPAMKANIQHLWWLAVSQQRYLTLLTKIPALPVNGNQK